MSPGELGSWSIGVASEQPGLGVPHLLVTAGIAGIGSLKGGVCSSPVFPLQERSLVQELTLEHLEALKIWGMVRGLS